MTDLGPSSLTVDVLTGGDGVTVAAVGDLDMATVDTLVDTALPLLSAPPAQLTIDLAGVPFCDSAGINGLVRLRNESERVQWDFRVINVRPQVHRVLVDLTGLGEFLRVTS